MNKRIIHWLTCQIKSISSTVKTLNTKVETIEENCCNEESEQNPSYITGNFSDGVFYTDGTKTEEITPTEDSIFIDQETGFAYYFDGNEYKVFSEYIDPAIVVIEEDGVQGYVTQYRRDNPNFYGNIGENAIDFSTNFSNSTTHGATGYYSFATGGLTTASGAASAAFGALSIASGDQAIATGFETIASGLSSYTMGQWTEAKSFTETARGYANYSPEPIATNYMHPNDLIESVGIGKDKNNKKNALARYKSGAWYWNKIKDLVSGVTNAEKGFHAADKDGRLNYFDGTKWHRYALEGSNNQNAVLDISKQTIQQEFNNNNKIVIQL